MPLTAEIEVLMFSPQTKVGDGMTEIVKIEMMMIKQLEKKLQKLKEEKAELMKEKAELMKEKALQE